MRILWDVQFYAMTLVCEKPLELQRHVNKTLEVLMLSIYMMLKLKYILKRCTFF